jgi:hypothetical protein
MIGVTQAFSPTYAQARTRFLEASSHCRPAGRIARAPCAGREGETLAMDVALDGPADAASC